jgi:hypothetical protein
MALREAPDSVRTLAFVELDGRSMRAVERAAVADFGRQVAQSMRPLFASACALA